jgi:hypothetical protein
MELSWAYRRCILCLREDVTLTRAHLVPEALGGFVWARTFCPECNNGIGSRIEAGVKHDPTIRYAIEEALAQELPDLARTFAEASRTSPRQPKGRWRLAIAAALSSSEPPGSMTAR